MERWRPVDFLFPEQRALRAQNICPVCRKTGARETCKTAEAHKEFDISGLCAPCQEVAFNAIEAGREERLAAQKYRREANES